MFEKSVPVRREGIFSEKIPCIRGCLFPSEKKPVTVRFLNTEIWAAHTLRLKADFGHCGPKMVSM